MDHATHRHGTRAGGGAITDEPQTDAVEQALKLKCRELALPGDTAMRSRHLLLWTVGGEFFLRVLADQPGRDGNANGVRVRRAGHDWEYLVGRDALIPPGTAGDVRLERDVNGLFVNSKKEFRISLNFVLQRA